MFPIHSCIMSTNLPNNVYLVIPMGKNPQKWLDSYRILSFLKNSNTNANTNATKTIFQKERYEAKSVSHPKNINRSNN